MSLYGTLTALTESPLAEGLLYAGTTTAWCRSPSDGGGHWRQAGTLPGVSELAFVNDLEASLHDADGVFAAIDAHKTGDFRPLLLESRDRGRTWRSIAGDLPEHTIVWAIAEDPVDPDLLFAGTEYGLYFTPDHGSHWTELTGGVPTIAFRDLEIQPRETTWWARPSAAASTCWTTTRRCARSRPGRSTRAPRSSRCATPGGTSPTRRSRPPADRRSAQRTSPPPTRRSARSSPSTSRRPRRPPARRATKPRRRSPRRARTRRSRAGRRSPRRRSRPARRWC